MMNASTTAFSLLPIGYMRFSIFFMHIYVLCNPSVTNVLDYFTIAINQRCFLFTPVFVAMKNIEIQS